MFFVFVFFGGSCRNVVVVVVDFLRFVSRAFLGFDFYVFRVPRSVRAPNASFAVRMKTKRSARAAKQKKLASVTGTTTHTHTHTTGRGRGRGAAEAQAQPPAQQTTTSTSARAAAPAVCLGNVTWV